MKKTTIYCCECLKQGRETVVSNDQDKGGGYYYCEICRGAVRVIAKTTDNFTLFIGIDPEVGAEQVMQRVKEILPGATGGLNGSATALQVDVNWTASAARELISRIPGVQETRFALSRQAA